MQIAECHPAVRTTAADQTLFKKRHHHHQQSFIQPNIVKLQQQLSWDSSKFAFFQQRRTYVRNRNIYYGSLFIIIMNF